MDNHAAIQEIKRGEDLLMKNKIDEALMVFELVLSSHPSNVSALNDKGVALNQLGRYDEAIKIFSQVLRLNKDNANAIFNLISNYFCVGDRAGVEDSLARYGSGLSAQDLGMIKNDLEKLKQREKETDNSLENMNKRGFNYNKSQERINGIFQKTIFFIVGCPKSGTTWLQNILNGHPDIFCPGESAFNMIEEDLSKLADRYNKEIIDMNETYIGHNSGYYLITKENREYLFMTLIGMLFSNLDEALEAKCVGTKNPDHMKCMETSARLIPNARYIHIIRDGRDVITSGMFHNIRVNPEGFKKLFPEMEDYVDAVARSWASDIRKAQSFGNDFPNQYCELRYEDLHRNPDIIIDKMLAFLGVDPSRQMTELCRKAGSFEKLAKGRKRGNEDRGSFFRKGIVGDWKNHFSQRAQEIFMAHAGDLLCSLRYEQ